MRPLRNVLNENYVVDYSSFTKYITSSESEIHIIEENELSHIVNYDSNENRIFEDEIQISGKFINAQRLNLRDSKNISFIDCVFSGELRISSVSSIRFASCIFMKKVSIIHVPSFSITSCNINELTIVNSNLEFSISYSRVYRLAIENSYIVTNVFNRNKIEYMELLDTQYEGVIIDSTQINLKNFNKIDTYLEEKVDENFVFKSILGYGKDDLKRIVLDNTMEFILKNTNINHNKAMKNTLLYNKTYNSHENKIIRFLIKAVGGFSKPYIWFIYLVVTILGFALIYLNPYFIYKINGQDSTMKCLWDSLYFSGITFGTIGYGDITPVGLARLFSIIEGIMGVSISSAFMVSFVRKYVD